MNVEAITLSPKIAAEILEMNTHNRPVREGYVELLANEIINGRWRDYTGDTIRISKDKIVLDGQHRMLAVVLANKAIKTHIIYGVDPNAMDVIDTGMRRQAADTLILAGVKNAAIVSAVIKYFKAGGVGTGMDAAQRFVSNRFVREMYNSDPVFWDNVAYNAYKWYSEFKTLTPKILGGCFAMALKESKHAQKVAVFFEALATGKTDHEIILKLRKILINNSVSARKYSHGAKRDMIQGHFNGFIKGQKYPYIHPDKIWL